MARVGRPQKPDHLRCGPIPGLARDHNGRWRILATGERSRHEDEDKVISLPSPRPRFVGKVKTISFACGPRAAVTQLRWLHRLVRESEPDSPTPA